MLMVTLPSYGSHVTPVSEQIVLFSAFPLYL